MATLLPFLVISEGMALRSDLEAVTKTDRKPAHDLRFSSHIAIHGNPPRAVLALSGRHRVLSLHRTQEFMFLSLTDE